MEHDLQAIAAALRDGGVNQALHRVGDRWAHMVLLALFTGTHRFLDFQQRLSIPKETLSARLKQLQAFELVTTRPYQTAPPRHEYLLAPKGLAMYPLALANWAWDRKWGKSDDLPVHLHHALCGHSFRPQFVCKSCGEKVSAKDVEVDIRPAAARAHAPNVAAPARTRRWQGRLSDADAHGGGTPVYAWLADRWITLIIGAIFLGCHRYDQLVQVLGIGTNILASRLDVLCQAGILVKRPDRHDGRAYFYQLSASGRDLFHNIVMMEQWAHQIGLARVSTVKIMHRSCRQPLTLLAACSHCREEVRAHDVAFR